MAKRLKEITQKFLIDCDYTGRFIVKSFRTGRKYYVEAIGDPHIEWGSLDQASGKMTTKRGWKKYRGSVDENESLITKENGFEKIHDLKVGENPLSYIDRLDSQYENK